MSGISSIRINSKMLVVPSISQETGMKIRYIPEGSIDRSKTKHKTLKLTTYKPNPHLIKILSLAKTIATNLTNKDRSKGGKKGKKDGVLKGFAVRPDLARKGGQKSKRRKT